MKKLALVLGGGATKGYAHIGVIKVLEDNGIKPSLIVGTSMGAVVGGVYASGKTTEHLIRISKQLTKNKIMDFNIFSALFTTGIMSGKKLKKVLYQEIGNVTHSELKIPFVAIATNILNGSCVLLQDGLVLDSILASTAIPGVYPMIDEDNQILCDGGLVNNVADDVAKKLAKDYVILSVDVIGDYYKQVENTKIKVMGATVNSLTLMQTQITKLKGNFSDIRLKITQPDVSQMSFDVESIEKSIDYGIKSMQRNVTKLKKLLKD